MRKNLFIDDIRNPPENQADWSIVRSYDDTIAYMKSMGCPEFISFDHDLGDRNAKTGYDVVKWMVERDLDTNGEFIPIDFNFTVHSANPVGAKNIQILLDNYLHERYIESITTT